MIPVPAQTKVWLDAAEVRRLRDQEGMGATEIARKLGIARTSVYRVLQQPDAHI